MLSHGEQLMFPFQILSNQTPCKKLIRKHFGFFFQIHKLTNVAHDVHHGTDQGPHHLIMVHMHTICEVIVDYLQL